jgi:hypothetical protein
MSYAPPDAGWSGIHGVVAATLSTRLVAICIGAALAFAQLLCTVHKAEALTHKPGEVCDLCLSVAKVDHALIDAVVPPPVHGGVVLNLLPTSRVPRAALVREFRARSPPSWRLLPLV